MFRLKVPLEYQDRVLTWGILGAVVMRALCIGLGEVAMSFFHPVLLGFAAVLIVSSYQLLTEGEGNDDEDLAGNGIVALASKWLNATPTFDGNKFFTVVRAILVTRQLEVGTTCHQVP